MDARQLRYFLAIVDSGGVTRAAAQQQDPAAFRAAMQSIPMKRIGDTEKDVGALLSFLLGDDSTYLTAQSIHVAGGAGVYR